DDDPAVVDRVRHDQREREEDQTQDEVTDEAVTLAAGDARGPERECDPDRNREDRDDRPTEGRHCQHHGSAPLVRLRGRYECAPVETSPPTGDREAAPGPKVLAGAPPTRRDAREGGPAPRVPVWAHPSRILRGVGTVTRDTRTSPGSDDAVDRAGCD